MRIAKKVVAIAFVLIVIKLLLSIYFNAVYYRTHPTTFSRYDLKPGFSPGFDPDPTSNELIMAPPIGGCVSTCSNGQLERVSCDYYSKAYDRCDYRCYGYVHDTCKGSYSTLYMLLVR